MSEQTTDYEGLFALTPELVDNLQQFLKRKETELADFIQHSFLPGPGVFHVPFIQTHSHDFHLPNLIPPLDKAVHQLSINQSQKERQGHWGEIRNEINKRLWEYVEIIEGTSTELYEELSLVGFDRWRSELFDTVKKINDDLQERVKDLKETIPKVEKLLWKYRTNKDGNGSIAAIMDRFQFWFTDILDSGLTKNLDKTDEFLKLKFKDFSERFDAYCKIDPVVSETLDQNSDYLIMKKMDRSHQDRLILLAVLLRCWEQARSNYKILQKDISRSIYQSVNINRIPVLFKDYTSALKQGLFETARAFKEGDTFALKPMFVDGIKVIRSEVKGLRSTVSSYREFIQGVNPEQATNMVHLIYELQHLDQQYERLGDALESYDDPEQVPYKASLKREIEGILHVMGQPLMSRKGMRNQVHDLVPRLQDCDEMGSTDPSILDFIGTMLNKALRLDWKYQTLQEMPAFHEVVTHHLGILGPIYDRQHVNRYGKFKKIVQHIEQWVKVGKTYRHIDEIEFDMNDIKEYLQDFLASIQRSIREIPFDNKDALKERYDTFSQMLLEYRYLFSNFFHMLRQQGDEGEYIRTQFQYIDRYFDAIELQLNNLKENVANEDEIPGREEFSDMDDDESEEEEE